VSKGPTDKKMCLHLSDKCCEILRDAQGHLNKVRNVDIKPTVMMYRPYSLGEPTSSSEFRRTYRTTDRH